MFYRRKIVLSLLEVFGGKLEKLRLQKLLFLFSQRQVKGEYDFIPYKYGCYSYSASADLTAMVKHGFLSDDIDGIRKNDKSFYSQTLKEQDRKILFEVKKLYGSLDGNALMKHTYVNHPYFAINSIKAKDLLSEDELSRIENLRPKISGKTLFTIGYEGSSVEAYLNKLIKNDIQVLIDVRRNPLSMKYGFSKSTLKKFCENIGIQYVHFPDLGIESDQRQELNSQNDYDNLFKVYKEKSLPKTNVSQNTILEILKLKERVALTCFEANICQCHRKPLSEAIAHLPGFEFNLKHI